MADLVHLQLVTPERLRRSLTEYVAAAAGVCNVVVQPDAARHPRGDVISFDVARETINDVLAELRAMGVDDAGSITLFHTDLSLSSSGDLLNERLPGEPEGTVIWDAVADRLHQSVAMTLPYLAFFVVASIIAAVGVLTDSPILIVGAMVVGPEYGALASVAFGLHRRDGAMMWQGASTFTVGTLCGVLAALVTALAVRLLDRVPAPYLSGDRPFTEFITDPDLLTVVVAAAAAVAGMLALTQDRAGTLVGVLISVTTIPAIAEIGVGLAFGDAAEVLGAVAQLGINLVCLVAVGVVTLRVLYRMTPRLAAARHRV